MATNQEALDQIKQYLNESYTRSTTDSVPKKNDLTFGNTVKKLEHAKIFYIDMRKSRKILTDASDFWSVKIHKAFLQAVIHCIEKREGHLRSFNGDGILAFFIDDNAASKAVRAAMDIKGFVNEINGILIKNDKNKIVFCNCDDPRVSSFFHYFSYNFEFLKLKKLITTCYKNQQVDLFSQNNSEKAIYLEYTGDKNNDKVPELSEIGIKHLRGDGDFRSPECIELLKQADIVVTNPPFSLFREYVAQLFEYNKKFVIIGSLNAITYKEIFKLMKDNKLWIGYGFNGGNAYFKTPYPKEFADGVYNKETGLVKFRNVTWFTNLEIQKRHENLIFYKTYKGNEKDYPKYDNYDAINIDKTKDIPADYAGAMGVPISFLEKHNPEQFEILGNEYDLKIEKGRGYINGKRMYGRIFIKNKKVKK